MIIVCEAMCVPWGPGGGSGGGGQEQSWVRCQSLSPLFLVNSVVGRRDIRVCATLSSERLNGEDSQRGEPGVRHDGHPPARERQAEEELRQLRRLSRRSRQALHSGKFRCRRLSLCSFGRAFLNVNFRRKRSLLTRGSFSHSTLFLCSR